MLLDNNFPFFQKIFDGLHKQLRNGFSKNSLFGKNYQKKIPIEEIICQKNQKNAKKILKNTEKMPTGLENAENSQPAINIQINCFTGQKNPGKF